MYDNSQSSNYMLIISSMPPLQQFSPHFDIEVYNRYLQESLHKQIQKSASLSQKLQEAIQKCVIIEQEKVRLEFQLEKRSQRKKRTYRRRGSLLEGKKLACPVVGCSKKYSSKIALNAHLRKKHLQSRETSQMRVSEN